MNLIGRPERRGNGGADLKHISTAVSTAQPLWRTVEVVGDGDRSLELKVQRRGWGDLVSAGGCFRLYDFEIPNDAWRVYHVLTRAPRFGKDGNPIFATDLTLRLDSGCDTSVKFGDRQCDCAEQLRMAIQRIAQVGNGLVVHIPHHEGRGHGLPFKLATFLLQERGFDTVEAARALAPDRVADRRTYHGCAAILKFFNITASTAIRVLTNNPEKLRALEVNGFNITRERHVAPITKLTARHILAKRQLGHLS